jgi:hypothetical protein
VNCDTESSGALPGVLPVTVLSFDGVVLMD